MHFADAAAWEAWLAAHHEQEGGVWLRIAKKSAPVTSVTISDALDVALCYGWIDSQRKGLDAEWYLQRYSRRRPRSPWSRVNVERVEALFAAGRMRPPGIAEVEAARADGRWARAYDAQRTFTVPADLASALAANPSAAARFDSLDRGARYQVVLPLLKAGSDAVRAQRIDKAVRDLLG